MTYIESAARGPTGPYHRGRGAHALGRTAIESEGVRKDKKGKHAVVAGRRRLLALASLTEAGTIASDAPIPCHVIAGVIMSIIAGIPMPHDA